MRGSYRLVFYVVVSLAAVAIRVTDSPPSRFFPRLINLTASILDVDALAAVPREADRAITLESLKKAHIASELPSGTLDSYRTDACIFFGAGLLAGKAQKGCNKGSLGVLMPSSAYLMVEVGKVRLVELVSAEGNWRFTPTQNGTTGLSSLKATKIDELKFSGLKEQMAHSVVSFLRLLNSGSQSDLSKLKLALTSSDIVVTWTDGATSNQFFFNRSSLLCEKQVRTTRNGVTVLKYSQYKNVSGVMLPHRVEMEGSSGTVISVEVIEAWFLGVSWPPNFFTPEGFVGD